MLIDNLFAVGDVLERHTMRSRLRRSQTGLLAAILAATLQFVFMAGSLSGVFSGSGAVAAIEQGGHCGEMPAGQPHNDAACALCPICLSSTLPGILPPAAPLLALPAVYAVFRAVAPAATGLQPSVILAAAFPRGPPSI